MRTVAEHQQAVAALLAPTLARLAQETEVVSLEHAWQRVLSEDLLAAVALPPFDNSQMDGYALRAAESGAELLVATTIPAGTEPDELLPGYAAPIMTGAKIPAGADTVVPVEAASPSRFLPQGESVELPTATPGQFVRRMGSDLAAGRLALAAGTRLEVGALGLLAALGISEVRVQRRARIALLSTGDEVQPPGTALEDGKIYDANSTLLSSTLRAAGAEVTVLATISDDAGALSQLLSSLPDVDVVISSGGISQGAFEVVKQAFSPSRPGQQHRVEFHSVAMQPGGPQALGVLRCTDQTELAGDPVESSGIVFLGFPGNPVSSLISCEVFLRPLLAGQRPRLSATLTESAQSPEQKHQVRRGFFQNGEVRLVGGTGSHLLHALAEANALVHFPLGERSFEAGQEVEVWLI